MVFSKESSRAIFEMCNVELIELKKSSIQWPICFRYVFERTLLCKCGKLLKPDQDSINRIKEAFEILKAPFSSASPISTRGSKCGPNLWQIHHQKARDALRSATKGDRGFTLISDRWQKDEIYRQSQLAHNWSDAWVPNLDHIVNFSIYHNATQQQRERNMNLLYFRSVDENRQAPLLSQRPGCREAKKGLINLQEASAYITRLILHCISTLSG